MANAKHVLNQLMDVVHSLSSFPERGDYPKELQALGIREYRQTSFKPYRVICRVAGRAVVIFLIADGRRDMQSVLTRRLLGALARSNRQQRSPARCWLQRATWRAW